MKLKKSDTEFLIQSVRDYRLFVEKSPSLFRAGNILLLSGQLGAGKTEFVKAIVEVLHQKQNAKSPTFALHHRYLGNPNIEHWDLYRLNSEEDLESSGFWDQFHDLDSFIIVEWPEKLKQEWLPQNWQVHHIHIEQNGATRVLKRLSKSAVDFE